MRPSLQCRRRVSSTSNTSYSPAATAALLFSTLIAGYTSLGIAQDRSTIGPVCIYIPPVALGVRFICECGAAGRSAST